MRGGVPRTRTGIKHAIHMAIGNTRVPPGAQPTTVSAAFQRVVEAMLLQAVSDMQRSGELDAPAPLLSQASPIAPKGS